MTNTELLTGDRTASASGYMPQLERPTRTSQDELADRVGFVHRAVLGLSRDTADVLRRVIRVQLDDRSVQLAKGSVPDLLDELADAGFAWRDIARLVGVTVPAVRKWRQGEPTTGAHRKAIAQLAAFINLVREEHLVVDVPSWLEMPLADSAVNGLDVYADGHFEMLLMYAANHLNAYELLDQVDPKWRDKVDNRFEVFTATDGQMAIRLSAAELPG